MKKQNLFSKFTDFFHFVSNLRKDIIRLKYENKKLKEEIFYLKARIENNSDKIQINSELIGTSKK